MKSSKVLEILNDSTLDGHTEVPKEENLKQLEKFSEHIPDSSAEIIKHENSDKLIESEELKKIKVNNDNEFSQPKKIIIYHSDISTQTENEIQVLSKKPDDKGKSKIWVVCIFFGILLSYGLIGQHELINIEKFVISSPEKEVCPPPPPILPQQSEPAQNCTIIRSPSIISYLDSAQCSEFNSLQSVTSKLEYLKTTINWEPMSRGSPLILEHLFSIQECKFFIGIAETSIYKFTLYQDFTKTLNFYKITSYLLSPDSKYLAISEDDKSLVLVDLEIFEYYALYSKLFNFAQATSSFVFSPDTIYLFYSRSDLHEVFVFKISTRVRIVEFKVIDFPVVSMKASSNLHHLIVKDSKYNLQIFNVHNTNYKHYCFDHDTAGKLALEFPEILEF